MYSLIQTHKFIVQVNDYHTFPYYYWDLYSNYPNQHVHHYYDAYYNHLKNDYDRHIQQESENEMRTINELKDRIKMLTQKAKLKEIDMLGEKEDLEQFKEALLMKEQEQIEADKQVQLELKRIQDISKRIDDKCENLLLPPPKYYFPPQPWSSVNGVYETGMPMVFCNSCQLHHHPHHHCTAMSACCNKSKVIQENFVYVQNAGNSFRNRDRNMKSSRSVSELNFFEKNSLKKSLNEKRKWIDYNNLSKYYQ
ncbi:UNKNOWN [Stylonychia lemnae]|uniref:Uncharacterized protein n=1 Tax=Stylonychia lemnae TaxID=5949 RepID=A0A077ZUM2_STYLE|nr:UNKNOWN [Stylonychia lemnae]|eukprot:CDW73587.1 UNKNOWN [Stylonychia lemnae]